MVLEQLAPVVVLEAQVMMVQLDLLAPQDLREAQAGLDPVDLWDPLELLVIQDQEEQLVHLVRLLIHVHINTIQYFIFQVDARLFIVH